MEPIEEESRSMYSNRTSAAAEKSSSIDDIESCFSNKSLPAINYSFSSTEISRKM